MKTRRMLLALTALTGMLLLAGCDFTQWIAHYANVAGWTTRLTIQNPHNSTVDVDITAYTDAGVPQGTVTLSIPARGFYQEYIQNIPFDVAIPPTGALKIVTHELTMEPSTISKVSCIAVFEYDGGPCMAGLQSFTNPQPVLNFPWFENSRGYLTGIALLNVNDFPITACLRAVTPAGTAYLSNAVTLAPQQRIIQYPGSLFPVALPAMTVLSAYASGKVAGFIILHSSDYSRAEAINGVPEIPTRPEFGTPPQATGIELSAFISQILFSQDGALVFVRTEDPHQLHVFNRHTRALLSSHTLGFPGGIALSPDGAQLYSCEMSQITLVTRYLIDATTGLISHDTFEAPQGRIIRFANSGKRFATAGGNGYTIWDAEHLSEMTHFTAEGTNIVDGIFTQDSRYFLAVDFDQDKLRILDLAEWTATDMAIGDSPNCIRQSPSTGKIYIGHNSLTSNVTVLDYPGFAKLSTTLSVGGRVKQMAFSPDGRYVYVPTFGGDQTLWVYDSVLNLFKKDGNFATSTDVAAIESTPEGEQVWFTTHSNPSRIMFWY